MTEDITAHLKEFAVLQGADLVGVADLRRLEGIRTIPADLLTPYTHGVVFGVHFPFDVFEPIIDAPTALYSRQQTTANNLLDHIGFRVQQRLSSQGHRAQALPASLVVDKQDWWPNLPTKAVARAAGLGWMGKNLLIINPRYGARVRYAVVLTDAPLTPDQPMPFRCGNCTKCVEACPVEAIKGAAWEEHPADRETALFFDRCLGKLKDDFAVRPEIGQPICGICIKACPWTNPRRL
ncbi:MAG: 4Fe-4S dicluster domain-containing protein [Syntrophomonas sp.]|nr:4Fe-4S dicluster domain-containing protein [Syntrophomonas sp.]